MAFVNTIARVHKQVVANHSDRAATHVVLRHFELIHHVQLPDDVGFELFNVRWGWFSRSGLRGFVLEWSVVLAVSEPFGIQADNFATAADIPQSITIDEW